MNIRDLGFTMEMQLFQTEQGLQDFDVARVILEHKERYIVVHEGKEYEAELLGALRFTAESRRDFPAVGDWVAIQIYDEDKALIHKIYPRFSTLERKAVGSKGQIQIIATNVNSAFIVQSVNRDFSINRLERYVIICQQAAVIPIIVLSKIDLISEGELKKIKSQISSRFPAIQLINVSSEIENGYAGVRELIESGKTYCLLGSSGVGKSTILNALLGEERMVTKEISEAIDRGKHTTTHRELVAIPNGGFIIDNPGMREVGVVSSALDTDAIFEQIKELESQCRFNNCTHNQERGCAVLEAVETGELSEEAFENYLKLQKEQAHFESDILERKRKDKNLGKLIKQVKKHRKFDKY